MLATLVTVMVVDAASNAAVVTSVMELTDSLTVTAAMEAVRVVAPVTLLFFFDEALALSCCFFALSSAFLSLSSLFFCKASSLFCFFSALSFFL